MRNQGKITHWNEEKGYGFITPSSGASQVFVHIRAFRNRHLPPELNQVVQYSLSTDKQGRPCAWRTKESTLHTLALIGGWPGALIAQQLLRHKSRKNAFQFMFWTTVVLNCVAFGWLFTAQGAEMLRVLVAASGIWK